MTDDMGFLNECDVMFEKLALRYTLCKFHGIFHGGGIDRSNANFVKVVGIMMKGTVGVVPSSVPFRCARPPGRGYFTVMAASNNFFDLSLAAH